MVFHFSNYHPGEETTQKELNYGYVTSNVATEREAYKVDPMYISGSPVAGRHQIGTGETMLASATASNALAMAGKHTASGLYY